MHLNNSLLITIFQFDFMSLQVVVSFSKINFKKYLLSLLVAFKDFSQAKNSRKTCVYYKNIKTVGEIVRRCTKYTQLENCKTRIIPTPKDLGVTGKLNTGMVSSAFDMQK